MNRQRAYLLGCMISGGNLESRSVSLMELANQSLNQCGMALPLSLSCCLVPTGPCVGCLPIGQMRKHFQFEYPRMWSAYVVNDATIYL